jgi:tRNA-Thr(GGU) m(6)t(6)A37 methyltransferase TsaA
MVVRSFAELQPIGHIRSTLTRRADAPKQGHEGGPAAWLELEQEFAAGARDLRAGDEILLFTWLHESERDVLEVYPRDDRRHGMRGVFSTRSPDRPNPIGLHPVTIVEVASATRFRVEPLEAIDGTPVIDIKPQLDCSRER